MSKINSSKGFSSGYNVNKVITNNQLNKKFKKAEKNNIEEAIRYPSGAASFILLCVFYTITLSIIFGVGFTSSWGSGSWDLSWMCVSIVFLLLNFLWVINRFSGLFDFFSYGLLKISRTTKIDKLRDKLEFYVHEPAVKDVDTYDDYKDYCKSKNKYQAKWCYISIITFFIIFTVSLIVYLTLFYQ